MDDELGLVSALVLHDLSACFTRLAKISWLTVTEAIGLLGVI